MGVRKAQLGGVGGISFFWFFCGEEAEKGLRSGFVKGVFRGREGRFKLGIGTRVGKRDE